MINKIQFGLSLKYYKLLFLKSFTFTKQCGERPLNVRTPKAFALMAKVALEFTS